MFAIKTSYLFKIKPTGQHKVDLSKGKEGTNNKILFPKGGRGKGVIREGCLLEKPTSKRGVY